MGTCHSAESVSQPGTPGTSWRPSKSASRKKPKPSKRPAARKNDSTNSDVVETEDGLSTDGSNRYFGSIVTTTYKGVVIAQSNKTVLVDGNFYFPPGSVRQEYLSPTESKTSCPFKGVANYYTLRVKGYEVRDAAWTFHQTYKTASHIKGFFAFYTYKGIDINVSTG